MYFYWSLVALQCGATFCCTAEHHPYVYIHPGFPGGTGGKGPAYKAGDTSLIPGSGRSPGEGNGKPLQYPCLENPMDREVQW